MTYGVRTAKADEILRDPIKNSLAKFAKRNPELEQTIKTTGLMISKTGLSKYDIRTINMLKNATD
jgi:hypothetical protein